MILHFAAQELQLCAESERLALRKWGPVVGHAFVRRVVQLASAQSFTELSAIRPLRLHKLSGVGNDVYALAIHGRWRLIVRKLSEREVLLVEVSNHYGN